MNTVSLENRSVATPFRVDSSQADVKDFIALMKPGVMSLVVFTSFCGMAMAPQTMHPFMMMVSLLCIAAGSGAAGAINMWYDRDIDAVMKRTALRPIPMGKIAPQDALTFGVILSFLSTILMMITINFQAGLWLAVSIAFYVFIYTMGLKRRTSQNIVIGGAAGAFPPVIGWVAATGTLSYEPWILFTIIFLWTPPHFWALALHQVDEYRKVNIPMLPVKCGRKATCNQIVLYSLLMVDSTFLPYWLAPGLVGKFYGLIAGLLGALFIVKALRVREYDDKKISFNLFWYSIIYLFMIFGALMVDHHYKPF